MDDFENKFLTNHINKLESINHFLTSLTDPQYSYQVWKIPSIDCQSSFYYSLPHLLPHENHISHHSVPYDDNAILIRRAILHFTHNLHLIILITIRNFLRMKIGRVRYRILLLSRWRWRLGLNGGSRGLRVLSRLMTCWIIPGFFIRNEEWCQGELCMAGKRKDGFALGWREEELLRGRWSIVDFNQGKAWIMLLHHYLCSSCC